MAKIKIAAIAGSTRGESFNKKLMYIAAAKVEEAGAEVERVDLRDLPMPLYDGDLEENEGLPAEAKRFKELLKRNQGFIFASPEYNSSISGVLKNAIDWASRPEEGDSNLVAFAEKTAALMSASPGHLGGLRGLVHLRWILTNIRVLVIPDQLAISHAPEAFGENGELVSDDKARAVTGIANKLVRVTSALKTPA